jgi:hypothetical protein
MSITLSNRHASRPAGGQLIEKGNYQDVQAQMPLTKTMQYANFFN